MAESKHITVSLGERSYDIVVGERLIGKAGRYIAEVTKAKRVLIVTDEQVAKLYLHRLTNALEEANITSRCILVKPGEQSKSFAVFSRVAEALLAEKPDRRTPVIALGGGVVGDLAGFCASVLLRGVPLVQIPTTLLSQVDSSVGGKTGINSEHGKNLIGTFYQPHLVLVDVASLLTLPERHLKAGYAEILKYGLLGDQQFFDWLEKNGAALLAGDSALRSEAVMRSCKAKASVVAADEREQGQRALLNLGHTFGHAFEAHTGFSDVLLHGEAVALGMLMAMEISCEMGHSSPQDLSRLRAHYAEVGLASNLRDYAQDWDVASLMDHFTRDKKVVDGKCNFVLLKGVGHAFVTQDVEQGLLEQVLQRACRA